VFCLAITPYHTLDIIGNTVKTLEYLNLIFSCDKLNSIAFIGFTPDPAARITVIS
jgi:hypothetical protein